jgi:hypothetical protein
MSANRCAVWLVVPVVMMAAFLASWSPVRQPTARMAVTQRAAGEGRRLSLAIRTAARMAPAGARMQQVITQPA